MAVGAISGVLSLRTLQRIGALLGDAAWHLRTRATRTTLRNLQLCFPTMDERACIVLARQSLRGTGMFAIESLAILSQRPQASLAWIGQVHGEAALELAHDRGGVIVLAPHIGNWELLNAYLGRKYQFAAMYAPPDDKSLDQLLTSLRDRAGGEMLPATNAGVRAMLRRLVEGRLVGHMPDQVPHPFSGGIHAPFFGVPALTSTLIARLAQRSGVTVICAFACRLPDGAGFDLHFQRAASGIASPDLLTAVSAINASVERCVQFAPDQYQWEYKRFKHPPVGQRDYYK